jgi:hypothetical protein
MRSNFVFFLILVLSFLLICPAFSQGQESITITTYYPAPYGVYHNLRLFPAPTEPVANCTLETEGTMYYDQANHQAMICGQNSSGAASWQAVGLWNRSGNNIFPADTDWQVGIGTDSPRATLDVSSANGIKLGLEKSGGGQLILANNPNDNSVYLEGANAAGDASAAAMFLAGIGGANLPQVSVNANNTNFNGNVAVAGTIMSTTRSDIYHVRVAAQLTPLVEVGGVFPCQGPCIDLNANCLFSCIAASNRFCRNLGYSAGTLVESNRVDADVGCIP